MSITTSYPERDAADARKLAAIDAAHATVPPHVAEFIATHRDERHGPKVAAKRRRDRERLPKSSKVPALSPEARNDIYADNWAMYGRGPQPGPLVYIDEAPPIVRGATTDTPVTLYPLDVSDDGVLAVVKRQPLGGVKRAGYDVVHVVSTLAATPARREGGRVHAAGSTPDGRAFRTRAEAVSYMRALAAADVLRPTLMPLEDGGRDRLLDFNSSYFAPDEED